MNITSNAVVGIVITLLVALFGGLTTGGVLLYQANASVKNDINSYFDAEDLYYSANQAYGSDTTLAASDIAKVTVTPNNTIKVNSGTGGYCAAGKSSFPLGSTYYRVSGTTAWLTAAPAAATLPTGVTCPTIP